MLGRAARDLESMRRVEVSNRGSCDYLRDEVERLDVEIYWIQVVCQQHGKCHPPDIPPSDPYWDKELDKLFRKRAEAQAALSQCEYEASRHRVTVDGLEVTQAIQNLGHNVPLIAGKKTVVRVYLSDPDLRPLTVRGEISVRGEEPARGPLVIPSFNTVTLDPALAGNITAKRHHAARSLNFILPSDMLKGKLQITLTSVADATGGIPIELVSTPAPLRVQFQVSPPLRVRILGIRYQQLNPPQTHTPSQRDFDLIKSWLRRAYPVAEVISSRAMLTWNGDVPFGCADINAQLAAIRAQDMSEGAFDRRTHYYGLVGDGGFFMRGCATATVASGPTGSNDWGWDYDGSYGDWYAGHELGHTFGRRHPGQHPGFCNETNDPSGFDPRYPFDNGQLSNADNAFVGFDVGDPDHKLPMVALPGVEWHDVMTYCQYQWLSSYTYEGISTRLEDENRLTERTVMEETAAESNLISVVATVNLTKQEGKIEYVNPLPQGETSRTEPDSPVMLRVKGEEEQVLREYQVRVKPLSDTPGADLLGLVDVVVAVDQDAREFELSVGGRTVDTFQSSAKSPGVRELRELTRVDADPDALSMVWETDAEASDEHTYTVQVSTDNGMTWQTLAVGLTTPEVTIDRNQFLGAQQVQVRVIATDGFTRSLLTSETFQV